MKKSRSENEKRSHISNLMLSMKEAVDSLDLADDIEMSVLTLHAEFLHIFDDVKDFREKGKVVYKLSDLLLLMLLYILQSGRQSISNLAYWCDAMKQPLEEAGIIHDGQVPSHDTFRRITLLLDPASVRQAVIGRFHTYLKQFEAADRDPEHKTYTLLNIDGQAFNGSGRSDGTRSPSRNLSSLNVYSAGMYLNLCASIIPEKTNEIPVAQALLGTMNLKGVIVTADALHAQRETCGIIKQQKGHFVITVKDNQGTLLQEIIDRFTLEKYQKRISVIERDHVVFRIYTLPSNYASDGFTGLKAFVEMTSRKKKGTVCTRYFITSLKDPEVICDAIEDRWSVENDLHRNKDLYCGEDSFRIANANACGVMGALNDVAVAVMKLYQVLTGKPTFISARTWFSTDVIGATRAMVAVEKSEVITNKITAALESKRKKH